MYFFFWPLSCLFCILKKKISRRKDNEDSQRINKDEEKRVDERRLKKVSIYQSGGSMKRENGAKMVKQKEWTEEGEEENEAQEIWQSKKKCKKEGEYKMERKNGMQNKWMEES